FLVRAQQGKVLRGAHLDGDGAERIDDRRAQRHQRQGGRQLGLEDVVLALRFGHVGRMAREDSVARAYRESPANRAQAKCSKTWLSIARTESYPIAACLNRGGRQAIFPGLCSMS